jgi:hypothetical protein
MQRLLVKLMRSFSKGHPDHDGAFGDHGGLNESFSKGLHERGQMKSSDAEIQPLMLNNQRLH